MQELIEKASVLMEALPYIRKFSGKTIVIKYGGAAMVEEHLKESFARDIVLLEYIGLNPVIVHGGGPQINKVLDKMGIKAKFVNGLRVTDEATMEVVEMVLAGDLNMEIVSMINKHGGRAVGLSGKDAGLIRAKKLPKETVSDENNVSQRVDLGRVGSVKAVDPALLDTLDKARFIPVIAPIGVDENGESLNINADLAAAAVASALKAEKVVFLTDVEGIKDAAKKLIPTIEKNEARRLIKEGVISGGMIPKVECALQAVNEGVKSAHIIDGRVQHAVLLEIFTDQGVGTVIS
ncbi:MAG: acetylglutamate kinase [Deltaproteobacteria bacterium]|nr:MAG: acetylglutamate kinase [Deltaproteobacteria bacterium]